MDGKNTDGRPLLAKQRHLDYNIALWTGKGGWDWEMRNRGKGGRGKGRKDKRERGRDGG